MVKEQLLSLNYKLEYNMMYKVIDSQGIKLVIDFADRTVGVCRVEMPKTFYLELDHFRKVALSVENELEKLKLRGIVI